jgi:all-trans-retinol dehydrogenase (NAD+)
MSTIQGSRALVTGAASGLGRLLALEMAREGAELVLWDIVKERLDAVAAEVASAGSRPVHAYLCDVGDREHVQAVAARVLAEAGPVDILVNNAGIVSGQTFLELPDPKIEATFRINTLALFWTTKAFLPSMVARNRGHVVTIASASGMVGVAKLADYAASKWAAVGFDESLRMELRKTAPGVRTTVVCPFYIDTGMFAGVKTRFSFILPILEPDDVARRTVDAVRRNKARLVMPRFVSLVPLMRMLPVPVMDALADFFGINASMDEFKGRDSARPGR